MQTLHRLGLAFLIGLISLACVGRAAKKPFWFDEIFTLAIARLPVSNEMWTAMKAGFEFNPPMIYLATHAANAVLGEGHITTRLPQILAGVLGLLVGFGVVARRAGVDAGFWFVLLLCHTPLYLYFFEARPYAFVFLGTMIAWYVWQRLADGRGSPIVNYIFLFGSLVFVLLSHLWGLIVPVAFLAAALALSVKRESIAWKEVLTVSSALPALALSASMIGSSRDIVFGGPVYLPTIQQATIGLYQYNLGSVLVLVLLITTSLVLWGRFRRTSLAFPNASSFPLDEMVLAFSLLIAPLFIFVVCKLVKSPFMPRYSLMSCVGGVIISSCVLSLVTTRHRILSYLAMILVGSYPLYQVVKPFRVSAENTFPTLDLPYLHDARYSQLPIVFAQPLRFLETDFYTPAGLAQRFIYVVDRDLAVRHAETDGVDSALIKGEKWIPKKGKTMGYDQFRQTYKEFLLLYDQETDLNWISSKLRADGALMSVVPEPGLLVLMCKFP